MDSKMDLDIPKMHVLFYFLYHLSFVTKDAPEATCKDLGSYQCEMEVMCHHKWISRHRAIINVDIREISFLTLLKRAEWF